MVGEGLHDPISLFVVCALRTAPALGPPTFMQGILHLTAFASLPFSLNDLPKVLELDVWQKKVTPQAGIVQAREIP